MGNPLIDQGVLNRLRASVVWTAFPALNVTASYLDKPGIRLALEGQASMQHESLTGVVQSPEPYLPITITIALLRTQPLADLYKTQWEANSLIGTGTVWPDVSTGLSQFQLQNMSIQSVGEMTFNGQDPGMGVICRGFYVINNSLWD